MKQDLLDASKGYKIERFLFKFLSKQIPASIKKREQLLERTLKEFAEIHKDVLRNKF
ncbi:MAG: hypothetical protein U0Z17_08095 [Bacteroidales bacterium]